MSSEEFWNQSNTTPATLDNFFEEDSEVNWTGLSLEDKKNSQDLSILYEKKIEKVSSIKDNVVTSSPSVPENIARGVGKVIGEKLDTWKNPTPRWTNSGNQDENCTSCGIKSEEIIQLKQRLERSYSKQCITIPPEDTINKIILGQPYSLENYRCKEDKIQLLEAAVNSLDGSAIIAVVIFLQKTLKVKLFHQELQNYPSAAQIYVNYLKQRHQYTEAIEILNNIGQTEDAAILRYKIALNKQYPGESMKNTVEAYFNDNSLAFEKSMIKDHISLLRWQTIVDQHDSEDKSNIMLAEHPRVSTIIDRPLLTTLYYCCMYHWEAHESSIGSPLALKKDYNLTDKQFLWSAVRGRARVKHWPLPVDFDNILNRKGLLGTLGSITGLAGGSGKRVKSSLPIERVVDMLANSGAQPNVLSPYISLIDSIDARLKVAMEYKCHPAIIDAYVQQKDKESLEKYLPQIPFGSPEYIKADTLLKTVKWKN